VRILPGLGWFQKNQSKSQLSLLQGGENVQFRPAAIKTDLDSISITRNDKL
jgi:hypothetical protein